MNKTNVNNKCSKILSISNFALIGIALMLALFFGFIIGLPKLHPGSYYFFPSNPQTGQ
jgi:hypothetical protein